MLKHIKNLLERNSLLFAILLTGIIAYLSLITLTIEIPVKISFFDKILHFSAYFTLSISWMFHFRNKRKSLKLILLCVFLFGILLEFMQGWFNPNRTKDVYDMLANGSGIIMAYFLFNTLYSVYKKIFGNYN